MGKRERFKKQQRAAASGTVVQTRQLGKFDLDRIPSGQLAPFSSIPSLAAKTGKMSDALKELARPWMEEDPTQEGISLKCR